MVNYKQQFKDSINIAGYIHFMLETDKLLFLRATTVANETVTMHNSTDNSNYQVPTGKKTRLIVLEKLVTNSAGDGFYYADDIDNGRTNEVQLFVPGFNLSSIQPFIFLSDFVPAGKYIQVFDVSVAQEYQAHALEVDA